MKRLVVSLAVVGALWLLPNPEPADAQKYCLADAIASCDEDFPGGGIYESAIRGYCYMFRWFWC